MEVNHLQFRLPRNCTNTSLVLTVRDVASSPGALLSKLENNTPFLVPTPYLCKFRERYGLIHQRLCKLPRYRWLPPTLLLAPEPNKTCQWTILNPQPTAHSPQPNILQPLQLWLKQSSGIRSPGFKSELCHLYKRLKTSLPQASPFVLE